MKNKNCIKLKKRKFTDSEKLPPCITQWKNKRGYMITLEKRLSNVQDSNKQININKFIEFNEELDKLEEKYN